MKKHKHQRGTKQHASMIDNRLSDLLPGEEAVIAGVNEEGVDLDRLRELGLSDGISLRVIKYAPLGDPIEIKVRGFHLSLRKTMAQQIRVHKQIGNKN